MTKMIILRRDGSLDCRVLLDSSDAWLGCEAIEMNNREAYERLESARKKGEGVFEDRNNAIRIHY